MFMIALCSLKACRMNNQQARQAAYRRGRQGERLASGLLRLKGYRILARDYRVSVGEIDLIAERGGLIAFVEVKARANLGLCLEAITVRQRHRIENAAAAFLAANPCLQPDKMRFDLIAVVPKRLPKHIMSAWQTDSP
jgi:putative endonuclease